MTSRAALAVFTLSLATLVKAGEPHEPADWIVRDAKIATLHAERPEAQRPQDLTVILFRVRRENVLG